MLSIVFVIAILVFIVSTSCTEKELPALLSIISAIIITIFTTIFVHRTEENILVVNWIENKVVKIEYDQEKGVVAKTSDGAVIARIVRGKWRFSEQ